MAKNKAKQGWDPARNPARAGKSGPQAGHKPMAESRGDGTYHIYGQHAVAAALANDRRAVAGLKATKAALENLPPAAADALKRRRIPVEVAEPEAIARLLPADAVHQGLALRVSPLPALALTDVPALAAPDAPALVLVLDQVTDPHNVGAMLRSAAAFGADALVTPDRHTPGESGALAKAASGCLELVPWVRVVNLSRALEELAELGLWRVGLDGAADKVLHELDPGRRVALVMGAEGAGLRHGTRTHCDFLARLPISPQVESLNVSNAAAVALYELARRRG